MVRSASGLSVTITAAANQYTGTIYTKFSSMAGTSTSTSTSSISSNSGNPSAYNNVFTSIVPAVLLTRDASAMTPYKPSVIATLVSGLPAIIS